MRQALDLAAKAIGRTSPNPLVGAVVVQNGSIVGTGYHAAAGQPHAEAIALREAGERARGATLYVTLEPCDHRGQTPPCTEAVLESGVTRVVAAVEDPDPRVAGRGIGRLRESGLRVEVGLLEEEARRLNAAYFKHRKTGLPLVTLKWAMSLDGRTATRNGSSRWITSEEARREAHRLRATHDAVLIGIGTALRDDPELTCRLPDGRDPIRVVVDSSLRLPPTARLLRTGPPGRVIVASIASVDAVRKASLIEAGAELLLCEPAEGRVSLRDLLGHLARRGVLSVLVEGGATVHAAFLEAGLADRVSAFVAPIVVGGAEAAGSVAGKGVTDMAQALRLRQVKTRTVGPDIWIEGEIEGHLGA